MSEMNTQIDGALSEMEVDAVGEILNISTGSAATAVSELLNAKVWITTPRVSTKKVSELNYQKLDPAIGVKIVYIEGISGANIMVLKQSDVQLILNQLMGMPLVVDEEFEFDEVNMSAVSEVMNMMMGASATALSEFLGVRIDISTPEIFLLEDENALARTSGFDSDDEIVSVNFDLTIDGVFESEYISVMDKELTKELAERIVRDHSGAKVETAPEEQPPQPTPQPQPQPMPQPQPQPMPQPQPQPQPIPQPQPQPMPQPQFQGQGMYGANMGYGNSQSVDVKMAQFQNFDESDTSTLSVGQQDNLKLLMNVPLDVTVEIGSTKKKVKDILEFSQGTIIELERQAGAPVDIIVNGHLIARGDVVVIDDNFAVRITDIIKSNFLDTLGSRE